MSVNIRSRAFRAQNPPTVEEAPAPPSRTPVVFVQVDLVQAVLARLREAARGSTSAFQGPTEETIRAYVDEVLAERNRVYTRTEREELFQAARAEVLGYGPIDPFLADPGVTEIMVNGPHDVYVERAGRLSKTEASFRDDAHVLQVIDRIVSPIGRRVDESSPMVDARLPDGSRVNVVLPPIAVKGPTITIRKFSKTALTMQQEIEMGTLTPAMASFLAAAVRSRLNMVVFGGTGSGKTTTLNALSHFIPTNQRVVTIEDAAELKLQQPHVVTLEARPANLEGKGTVTIRQLVINALRMRPDRIIVGEVRGGEALDMLQAMNTGHDGSLTTAHANSPRDLFSRLETMVLMSGADLPLRAIREQIRSALDILVNQARMRDGTRRIVQVSELVGMEGEVLVLQDIFLFHQTAVAPDGTVHGEFRPTGVIPQCVDRMTQEGQHVDMSIFRAVET